MYKIALGMLFELTKKAAPASTSIRNSRSFTLILVDKDDLASVDKLKSLYSFNSPYSSTDLILDVRMNVGKMIDEGWTNEL